MFAVLAVSRLLGNFLLVLDRSGFSTTSESQFSRGESLARFDALWNLTECGLQVPARPPDDETMVSVNPSTRESPPTSPSQRGQMPVHSLFLVRFMHRLPRSKNMDSLFGFLFRCIDVNF